MRALRRFFSILLGIAAGTAAWKILKDYGSDGHIEGEFIELPLTPETEETESPGDSSDF